MRRILITGGCGFIGLNLIKNILDSKGWHINVLDDLSTGKLKDLKTKINKDAKVRILTFEDPEGRDVFWHSASHLMTQAVLRVFPNKTVGLGVGVATENGYYQDYGMLEIKQEDLEKIEKEMQKIVDEKLEIDQRDVFPRLR